MKRQLLISFFILLFLGVGTLVAVLYGRGYRLDFSARNILKGTGLLVATSTPDGAQVFINGHLTTATNNTINLAPGQYTVRIFKDGYFPWEKSITINEEVVSKAEALLFPTTPKLESITETGALSPVLDPSLTKIAYVVASQSARVNGVYVLDMGNRSILSLTSAATQIADDTTVDFTHATLSWSPDGKQLLATVPNTSNHNTIYLLDTTQFNQSPQDVTETLSTVTDNWNTLTTEKQTAQLNTLKPTLKDFAASFMSQLSWSPDQTKFTYIASASGLLTQIITPKIIGSDATPEDRNLVKGNMYLYDTKEDKNFLIAKASDLNCGPLINGQSSDTSAHQPLAEMVNCQWKVMWFPDSSHLIVVHDHRVDIREYDGANNTTIYAGPFVDNDGFPWPTGDNIVVLTDLGNSSILPNLYTISLK